MIVEATRLTPFDRDYVLPRLSELLRLRPPTTGLPLDGEGLERIEVRARRQAEAEDRQEPIAPVVVTVQGQQPIQPCTASWNFDFGQFANQIERNRFDLSVTLATLLATEAVGTMPKTPSELRGLGVPRSELNPTTNQLSRWSYRVDLRALRTFGRTAAGVALSTGTTAALVFEGFYDIGVIGDAAWDAMSRPGCGQ